MTLLSDQEISKLKKILGKNEVIISPGKKAKTFHKDRNCKWMNIGRIQSATKGFDLLEPIVIYFEEAVEMYKRMPCKYCFPDYWIENSYSETKDNFESELAGNCFKIGDIVFILEGPFKNLGAEILKDLGNNLFESRVIIFGRPTIARFSMFQIKLLRREDA